MKKSNLLILNMLAILALVLPSCMKQRVSSNKANKVKVKANVKNNTNNLLLEKATIAHNTISHIYEQETTLLRNYKNNETATKDQFKKLIIIKSDSYNKAKRRKKIKVNQYKNFPFVLYKTALDKNIVTLEKQLSVIDKKIGPEGAKLAQSIEKLIEQLETINQHVLLYDEYHKEILVLGGNQSLNLASGLFKLGFAGISKGIGVLF